MLRDRIEMHLVSAHRQDVHINGTTVSFEAGESIHTENCYKRTMEQFEQIAHEADWFTTRAWADPRNWFSVQYLSTTESADRVVQIAAGEEKKLCKPVLQAGLNLNEYP